MHILFYFVSESFMMWVPILQKLKDFTLPAGDEMLDKWIASIVDYDKDLKTGDMKHLTNMFKQSKSVIRALLPHIPNKIVRAAVASCPNRYEQELEKAMASGGGKIDALDRFFRFASRTLLSAMNKAKPTAETLN